MRLEDYLLSIGYRTYRYNFKLRKFEEDIKYRDFFSTYDFIDIYYIKESVENIKHWSELKYLYFIFGLHQYPYPPSLIYPRPNIQSYPKELDIYIHRIIQKYSGEEIYQSIKQNETLSIEIQN